jgi:hypothetical protein
MNQLCAYPELRTEYTRNVGSIGETVVNLALDQIGYDITYNHKVDANGVDIELDIDTGVEVWNHAKAHSYRKKIDSVKNNLKPYKHKFLVTSFISKPVRAELEQDGICVIATGFQILLNNEIYLIFYSKSKGKRYFSDKTIDILTNIIKPYFQETKSIDTKNGLAYVYTNTLNYLNEVISNIINRFTSVLSSKFYSLDDFNLKIRLKNYISSFKSSVKARLSKPNTDCLDSSSANCIDSNRLTNCSISVNYDFTVKDTAQIVISALDQLKKDLTLGSWNGVSKDDIVINGEEVSSDRLLEVWNSFCPRMPMPKIEAMKVQKDDFQKLVLLASDREHSRVLWDIEESVSLSNSFTIQVGHLEYLIFIVASTSEFEDKMLRDELSGIYLLSWQTNLDTYKDYMR